MGTGGSGGQGYLKYGYESAFKGGSPSPARAFGFGQKLAASDKKNNLKNIYGLGTQDASYTIEGIYEGRLSVDFEVSNMWFLPSIMGMAAGTPVGGAAPYTWSPGWANTIPSMVIENGLELGGTDVVQTFKGVVAEQLSLDLEVGNNPIHAKLDCLYADEARSTTSSYGTAATDTQTGIFNFAHSKLEFPTATVIGEVEKANISIKRNPKLIYGLGSRLATQHVEGIREYEVEFTTLVEDVSFIEYCFGGATGTASPSSSVLANVASMLLAFSNDGWGAAAAGSRRFSFQLNNCKIDSFSPPMEVENAIMQTVRVFCRSITPTVINQEATKPADVTA